MSFILKFKIFYYARGLEQGKLNYEQKKKSIPKGCLDVCKIAETSFSSKMSPP